MLYQFLKGEAEKAGQEYAEASQTFIDRYTHLLALNNLICGATRELRGDFSITGPQTFQLRIPAFKVPGCACFRYEDNWLLFDSQRVDVGQAVKAERARLQAGGIWILQ